MCSVLHTTPHTYSDFSPACSDSTLACVREGARMGSFFQCTLGFIRAIAGRKLHLQFLCAIPLFTFTHDSCVMSTICHNAPEPRSPIPSDSPLARKRHCRDPEGKIPRRTRFEEPRRTTWDALKRLWTRGSPLYKEMISDFRRLENLDFSPLKAPRLDFANQQHISQHQVDLATVGLIHYGMHIRACY